MTLTLGGHRTGSAGLAVTKPIIRPIKIPATSAQTASQSGLARDAHSPVVSCHLHRKYSAVIAHLAPVYERIEVIQETGTNEQQTTVAGSDVTVIGGGLAGMAACIHLAKAGLRVLCIDAGGIENDAVGESLDWSAPGLLADFGLTMDRLIEEKIATYKRHVTLKLGDGCDQSYIPGEWLGRPPFNIELRTLHVDGRRVEAVTTQLGKRISSPWFIDASGSAASLFARAFQLPTYEAGPRKVAIWGYFPVTTPVEGTTLYSDGVKPPYMEWVWEIPINPDTISVGYVAAAETIKVQRQQGETVEAIYREKLGRFPRFESLLRAVPATAPAVTSFICRMHGRIAGPNWLIAGEAAAMVDPMTANGVTAALRHAAEASRLLIASRGRKRIPWLAAAMYSRRILDLAMFFNYGIERVIYESPVRNRIGVLKAGDVYTVPAWSLNSIYSRLQPRGLLKTLLFCSLLNFSRLGIGLFYRFCKWQQPAGEAAA
jgi:flavin-dependent dehydrogenase